MIQNSIKSALLLTLISLVSFSCHKENFDTDLKAYRWKLVKLKGQDESFFKRPAKDYFLEFISDSTLGFSLDVNDCSIDYKIINSGNIEFGSNLFCTKACCDSEFAEKFKDLIPLMTSYYGKGDKLIFEGQGQIILVRDDSN